VTLADLARAELETRALPRSARPPLEALRRAGFELDVSRRPAGFVDGCAVIVTATMDRVAVVESCEDDRAVVTADRVEMVDDPVWRPVRQAAGLMASERGRLRAARGRTRAPAI
jgi:hypothetical protein